MRANRSERRERSERSNGSLLVRTCRRLDNVTSVSTALRGGVIRPRTRHQIGLAELLGARAAVSNPLVSGITIDSRLVRPGDLYVALSGAHHHGAEFARQAAAAGAVAILTDTAGSQLAHQALLPVVVVDHPRHAMAGGGADAAAGAGDERGLPLESHRSAPSLSRQERECSICHVRLTLVSIGRSRFTAAPRDAGVPALRDPSWHWRCSVRRPLLGILIVMM